MRQEHQRPQGASEDHHSACTHEGAAEINPGEWYCAFCEQTIPKIIQNKAYVIEARTGCSCCSNENHYRGPYKTKTSAEKAVEDFQKQRLLASQYSKTGIYSIEEHDCEVLPGGRIIIDRRVFDGFCEDTGDDYIGQM